MSTKILLERARVLGKLGLRNVARVAAYRALVRTGAYRLLLPPREFVSGPFFEWPSTGSALRSPRGVDASAWSADAQRVLSGELPIFSNGWAHTGFPPRWHRSVLSGADIDEPSRHWTRIPDFGLAGGDIKGYWEPARFDGLVILALGWILTRRDDMRQGIEAWLTSWCASNPANVGVQWKCGQETGIRLMHLLLVAELLRRWGDVQTTPQFGEVVVQHCARIAPTMLYALAQDNNHGTSEATALFAGGLHLERNSAGKQSRRGAEWKRLGRRWLEERLDRLVMRDGSFSQHSVNYHRMMLDTCCFAETWRRVHGEPAFSDGLYERCRAASQWLLGLTDRVSGDAPNLGANDGTRLFVLHRSPYRDHRASVQWASVLFARERAYPEGPHDETLSWLELEPSALPAQRGDASHLWPDGGYAKLVAKEAWILLRIPRFKFRPSQADALHIDLWVDGRNILRDGGTFSYNTSDACLSYFRGAPSHNTAQFDGRDPMPHITRFLFGCWLECSELDFSERNSRVTAAYRDHLGAIHRRTMQLRAGGCVVTDVLTGFFQRAVLRWRFAPALRLWEWKEGWWVSDRFRIRVQSSTPPIRVQWVKGWESCHYGAKTQLPVLDVEVSSACKVTTELSW